MSDQVTGEAAVPADLSGQRLDQIAAVLFPQYSRARLQTWIRDGMLRVGGDARKPRDKAYAGECLTLEATIEPVTDRWVAEPMPLRIVFEDEHLLVLDKPSGLVVHPAAGHARGTLLNALLHHCPELERVPRAGIVHRLDRDTTGLMVVAKHIVAQNHLVAQLQARTVHRQYDAVVSGVFTGGGTVDAPMGRHPRDRKRMAVLEHGGKPAVTHYRVRRRFAGHTHVMCLLETGRTHQIRVHMAHIRHPLVGDPVYGGRPKLPKGAGPTLVTALQGFGRQALHARRLELVHPASGDSVAWEIALPSDMAALLTVLRADAERGDI